MRPVAVRRGRRLAAGRRLANAAGRSYTSLVTSPAFVDGLKTRLLDAPEGKRSLLGSLVRFGVTGVLSVAVDVGTLTLLHSGLGVHLLVATLGAFGAGLIVNYSLNRNWTFQAQAEHRQTLRRYFMMVAFNFTSTLLIVLGLTHIGLYYLLSKLVAVALNAVINFLTSRFWVFNH
jgi:putative flippase GtrA